MEIPHELPNEGLLVRRMHKARIRQWVVAVSSIAITSIGITVLSPNEIGKFAYYALVALMLLNATIALLQSAFVLFPIELLLRKIRHIEHDVDTGKLETGHLPINSNDVFACLTAGIDNLISKLSEKARAANERAVFRLAMLHATPFTFYTVSRTGKVLSIVKDAFGIISLLGIKVGKGPSKEIWGDKNANSYLQTVAKAFDSDDILWFELDIGAHRLRGSIKRLNDMTAFIALGDMPAIDDTVAQQTGSTNEASFSYQQGALKRFAASVAHDGKNVFAALNNLVELNRHSTDPNVREQVPIAEDAIRRGTLLMSELTNFAGESHFKLVCTPAVEGLRAIFESPTIKVLLPENVQMISDFSDVALPEIDLDLDQSWKAGFNLVKNAIEAMNGHIGRIWVSAKPFQMTDGLARAFRHSNSLRIGKGILITVADDGPGIPAEMVNRIFEPYFTSKGEGHGFGLATLATIVEAHSGAIMVKSSPGSGTAFDIYLPASRNSSEELKMIKEIAPNGEILLIDDDPSILHTTKLVLHALKVAAHPASTAEDAMAKLRSLRTRVKFALVDGRLRGVSTAQLVRQIHDEFPSLPVIIASGAPKEVIDREYNGIPYTCFLSKPYSVADLKTTLKLKG